MKHKPVISSLYCGSIRHKIWRKDELVQLQLNAVRSSIMRNIPCDTYHDVTSFMSGHRHYTLPICSKSSVTDK
eukprot:6214149-Pleurochrysis_carterae.AAC.5